MLTIVILRLQVLKDQDVSIPTGSHRVIDALRPVSKAVGFVFFTSLAFETACLLIGTVRGLFLEEIPKHVLNLRADLHEGRLVGDQLGSCSWTDHSIADLS